MASLYKPAALRIAARRFAAWVAAFLVPILVLQVLGYLGGRRFLGSLALFARTANQSGFQEGWSLPMEYLWHAEHFLLIAWAACAVYGVARSCRTPPHRLHLWLGGLACTYGCLVVSSCLLQRLTVSGCLVRQTVPFLALLLGYALERLRLLGVFGRIGTAAACLLLVAQGAYNLAQPLCQMFPKQFHGLASASLGEDDDVEFMNVRYLRVVLRSTPMMPYVVLHSAANPAEYLPYQYETYTAALRREFRRSDVRMKAIRYEEDPDTWRDEEP